VPDLDLGKPQPGFINYTTGDRSIKYYHGYCRETTGTNLAVQNSDNCICCHSTSKATTAKLLRAVFDPPSTATAVPVAYEAWEELEAACKVEPITERKMAIMELPAMVQYLTVKHRLKKQNISPEDCPAYLASWRRKHGAGAVTVPSASSTPAHPAFSKDDALPKEAIQQDLPQHPIAPPQKDAEATDTDAPRQGKNLYIS
jgi:hypothetical protein